MKKISLVLAVVLIFSAVLCACGKTTLSGKYAAEKFGTGAAFTFKGSNVTMDITVLGIVTATLTGTYEIADGKITLNFTSGDEEQVEEHSGTYTFSQTENSVTIGVMEYATQEYSHVACQKFSPAFYKRRAVGDRGQTVLSHVC